MADFEFADGREIDFDLSKISIREYKALFDRDQSDEDEYATLAKVSGVKPGDVEEMPLDDWKRFYKTFITKATTPLEDPN